MDCIALRGGSHCTRGGVLHWGDQKPADSICFARSRPGRRFSCYQRRQLPCNLVLWSPLKSTAPCLDRRRGRAVLCLGNEESSGELNSQQQQNNLVGLQLDWRDLANVDLDQLDNNQLQTALNHCIEVEDYAHAARLTKLMKLRLGVEDGVIPNWYSLRIPEWMAHRIENLGFRFPTEVQRRAALIMIKAATDVIIQSETGTGKSLAFLVPLLALVGYDVDPSDMQAPHCVVVVPTRELGVQVTMLIYKILGGSVNAGVPGQAGNMFNYWGPRGIKVRGVLDKEEVLLAKHKGYLQGVHIVVGTPSCLAEVISAPEAVDLFNRIRGVAVDEADLCFSEHAEDMEVILSAACSRKTKDNFFPLVAYAGATVEESLAEVAVQKGWMIDPVTVNVGNPGKVPKGLRHRYLEVDPQRKMAVLSRQIRKDLRDQSADASPPRVILFTGSEERAQEVAGPLRNSLWAAHKVSVLLPSGEEPILALQAFRDNKATVLVATPSSSRGLDLPAVSHVYNLDLPQNATDYLHRAGRAGRIGATVRGIVTTIVSPDQLPYLQALAAELGSEFEQIEEPSVESVVDADSDVVRTGLEDLFNLQ